MQKGQDNGPLSTLGPHKIADFVGKDKSKISPTQRRKQIVSSLGTAALVIAADQLSKLWIRGNLAPTESLPEKGFLDLVYVENYGSAFGLLANQTFLLIAITIASLFIILLFFHYLYPATTLSIVSTGLILGGAIGNLIDRFRFGCVTDFIHAHLEGLFHWPAFNLADTAIVVGIFTFIYSLYRCGLFRKVYEDDREIRS